MNLITLLNELRVGDRTALCEECGRGCHKSHSAACGIHADFGQRWVALGGHPGAQRVFAAIRTCPDVTRLNFILQRDDFVDHCDDPAVYYSVKEGPCWYPGGLRDRLTALGREDLLEGLDICRSPSRLAGRLSEALRSRGGPADVWVFVDFRDCATAVQGRRGHRARRWQAVLLRCHLDWVLREACPFDETALVDLVAAFVG